MTLARPQAPQDAVTPDFMLRLISGAPTEFESRNLLLHLVRESLRKITVLIQEFIGHPNSPENVPGNRLQSYPNDNDILVELLSYTLGNLARSSIIGVPLGSFARQHGASFRLDSWWNKDAPSLPLNLPLLWARSLAWHIFWLLIKDGRRSSTR